VFTPRTIAFLRALKRNNDRDWFRAHRDEYERHVRQPAIALLARLDRDLRPFAPRLVADPKISLFRIYRDTRFSADKSPLKTQLGVVFPDRHLRKRGAALYFEIGPDGTWIGGGVYNPDTPTLVAVREAIAGNHRRFTRIVENPKLVRATGGLQGETLARVPRGFPADHPAAEYLRHRQFLAGCDRPAAFAFDPRFYRDLTAIFRLVAPLVLWLNEALDEAPSPPGL